MEGVEEDLYRGPEFVYLFICFVLVGFFWFLPSVGFEIFALLFIYTSVVFDGLASMLLKIGV